MSRTVVACSQAQRDHLRRHPVRSDRRAVPEDYSGPLTIKTPQPMNCISVDRQPRRFRLCRDRALRAALMAAFMACCESKPPVTCRPSGVVPARSGRWTAWPRPHRRRRPGRPGRRPGRSGPASGLGSRGRSRPAADRRPPGRGRPGGRRAGRRDGTLSFFSH